MELLIFAHFKEAQAFIEEFSFKKEKYNHFFKANDKYLFICGEGMHDNLAYLPFLIAKYSFSRITNIGIAGALNKNLHLESIYPIRTCYSYGDKPKFHSFTLDNKANIDCISRESRVYDKLKADQLSNFAQIVDRELWGICKIASLFKIPVRAFKIISDYADNSELCLDIRENTEVYSNKLLHYYLCQKEIKETQPQIELDFLEASFTQKSKIIKLFKKIKLSHQASLRHLYDQFLIKENKKDINSFIKYLDEFLCPINKDINKKTNYIQDKFKKIGARLDFDPRNEKTHLKLSMDINSQANLDKLSLLLEDFQYQDIEDFINGDLNV